MEEKHLQIAYQFSVLVILVLLLIACKEAEPGSEESQRQNAESNHQVSADPSLRIISSKRKVTSPNLSKKGKSTQKLIKRTIQPKEDPPFKKSRPSNNDKTTISPPSFMDNSDGTVTDENRELVWQQIDDNKTRSWEDAESYCKTTLNDGSGPGGWSDWRLPNRKELASIIKSKNRSPAVDHKLFPGTNSSTYWSSTTKPNNNALAWGIYFGSGYSNTNNKTNRYFVRCVRSE